MKEHQLKGRKPHQLTSTLKILIPGQLCSNTCTLKIYNFSHYQREKYSKLLKTDLQYLIKNVLVAFSISAEYISALMWNANAMKPFRNCSGTTKTCQWLEEANTALYKLHRTFKIKKFLKKKIYIYTPHLSRDAFLSTELFHVSPAGATALYPDVSDLSDAGGSLVTPHNQFLLHPSMLCLTLIVDWPIFLLLWYDKCLFY